jgi:2'-5' RNA ligase
MAESFFQLSQKNSHIKKIRWTPAENLHITLFFIGEVEEHNLDKIKLALHDVLNGQHSFALEFDEIELRGRKHPSMLWGKFKKSESFSSLSEKIYKSLREFMTIEVAHKDPVPHCTLARIKTHVDLESLNKNITLPASSLNIDRIELWQTEQTKEGVKYKCLEEFPLQK